MATSEPDTPGFAVRLPSPSAELQDDRLDQLGVRLYLKRDDLIHPDVPGNKWRKLKYNLAAAREQGHTRLLTFGGAFSNHIRAVAAAGQHLGFETAGVIRGEKHLPLNESLAYAVSRGMRLTYMDRSTYRRKTDPDVLAALVDEFGPCYVVPEGGSNALGVQGCAELPGELDIGFDVICCASGTGGTLAGVAAGVREDGQRALGFAVLKGGQANSGRCQKPLRRSKSCDGRAAKAVVGGRRCRQRCRQNRYRSGSVVAARQATLVATRCQASDKRPGAGTDVRMSTRNQTNR
jgi:1-aminocyclopropane-1-carboxylate deaminase/D-cysteine desulfhydrase-like pyridoxal-dependent ACC family enzyme